MKFKESMSGGKREGAAPAVAGGVTPLEVHDLTISYNRRPVLWDIDFSVPEGKLIAIVGPNGAGKSTLIKGVMGLLPLASGYVKFFGENLESVRSRVGYVPQRNSVDWDFPTNVLDVVLMGRYGRAGLFRRPRASDVDAAREALHKVGISDLAGRQISQLSGGQQQRVAIARALANDPPIVLADEPTGNLDSTTGRHIMDLLLRVRRARLSTLVLVTHDAELASFADRRLVLRDGRPVPSADVAPRATGAAANAKALR